MRSKKGEISVNTDPAHVELANTWHRGRRSESIKWKAIAIAAAASLAVVGLSIGDFVYHYAIESANLSTPQLDSVSQLLLRVIFAAGGTALASGGIALFAHRRGRHHYERAIGQAGAMPRSDFQQAVLSGDRPAAHVQSHFIRLTHKEQKRSKR